MDPPLLSLLCLHYSSSIPPSTIGMVWIVLVMKRWIGGPFLPHFTHILFTPLASFPLDLICSIRKNGVIPPVRDSPSFFPIHFLLLASSWFVFCSGCPSSNFVLLSNEGGCLTGIHSRARRRSWITNRTGNSNPETNNPGLIFFIYHNSHLRGSNHRSPGTDWILIVMYSSSSSVLQQHEGTPFRICEHPRPRPRVPFVVVGERVEGVKDMSSHDRLDSRKLRLLKIIIEDPLPLLFSPRYEPR